MLNIDSIENNKTKEQKCHPCFEILYRKWSNGQNKNLEST